MKKALIFKNKIIQIVDQVFPVVKSMEWIECPDECKLWWRVVDGSAISPTQTELDTVAAEKQEANADRQTENDNANNIKNDAIISAIKNKSLHEIENYIEGIFSTLAGMSGTDIDTYIDENVTDLPSAKSAIKVVAKDLNKAMSLLKIAVKISVWLAKKSLDEVS